VPAKRDGSQQRIERILARRQEVLKMKQDVLEEVDARLSGLVEECLRLPAQPAGPSASFDASVYNNRHAKESKSESSTLCSEKEFMTRESYLTALFKVPHVGSIYNLLFATVSILFVEKIITDCFINGHLIMDFDLLAFTFSGFVDALVAVVALHGVVGVVYLGFLIWTKLRPQAPAILVDGTFISLYLWALSYLLAFPAVLVWKSELAFASRSIVLAEQVRLGMKMHAFVRANAQRAILHFRGVRLEDCDKKQFLQTPCIDGPCPNFSRFIYFLFAPTLVYRDTYPRTSSVRWGVALRYLGQLFACIGLILIIVTRLVVEPMQNAGKEPIAWLGILSYSLLMAAPCSLAALSGWYSILHCWLNCSAELLRFGDRMFYTDWWTSRNYPRYYRTWNIVVHDWLYEYVYKDLLDTGLVFGSRRLAAFGVFSVSVFFHEYIMTLALGYFMPMFLLLFGGWGVLLTYVPFSLGNRFMWYSWLHGYGLFFSTYSLEWYSRRNCPSFPDSWWSEHVPRVWNCQWNVTETPI